MDPKTSSKYRFGVTARAIIVGLILIPINSYWIFMSEIVRYQGHPTTISLFYSSVFNLVLLILLNGLIRRVVPKWVFSQGELITIYVMLNLGAAMVSHDSLQVLISMMAYPTRFATPDNKWGVLFENGLPDWLVVKDPIAVKNLYTGGNLYDPANYGPWIVPVLCWSAFAVVLVGIFLCMNVLLRKQWTEREKLSYPLVQLPLDMTQEGAPLFRDKLLWIGFALVAAIDIWNGLAVLYPSIPQIPIKLGDKSILFTTRPWNFIGWLPINFYPFAIGLGMLLPVDLLFSCWFFFWVWKAQNILMAVFGLETVRGMPFMNEQSFGAYMGIALFAIYVSKKHLIEIIKHFLGQKTDIDDSGEPIPYRMAVWGIILGCAFLTFFSLRAGLDGKFIIPFFLFYFAISIAITRMRAELGLPAHDLHMAGPDTIIAGVLGPNALGTRNLSVFSLYWWFNRAYRSHPMPFQLEGFKMAEKTGMSYRRLYGAMGIATVFGTIVAFWVMLHLLYANGMAQRIGPPNVPLIFGWEPWNRMDGWLKVPQAADSNRLFAVLIGLGVTLILNFLRLRVGWFPFHPVGYAVSSAWSMQLLWVPLCIAWMIKLVVLRYGGLKLYRKALPFFLGMILGECVVGSFWTIWGIIMRVPSYPFWP